MPIERVYWDSNVFISLLERHPERAPVLDQVMERADKREVEIITSAFTLCEVARFHSDQTEDEQEEQIEAFFENPYIVMRQVDRQVALRSRSLVRRLGIKGKDAVHVASALETPGVSELHTYDEGILNLGGRLGEAPLRIVRPRWKDGQPPLELT